MIKYLFVFIVFLNVVFNAKWNRGLDARSVADHLTISKRRNTAPFGEITGYASTNVPAYSNRDDNDRSSGESHCLYGVYMGAKWQCVEYARRWLFLRKGCIFDDVGVAPDIWHLDFVQRVIDKKYFNFIHHPNGSPSPPKNESLLIYDQGDDGIPYGHVAVIVDVSPTHIRVAEQNYDFNYWNGNYAREIQYQSTDGKYFIDDFYDIVGWMNIELDKQTKPLDQPTIDRIIRFKRTSPDPRCRH